MNIQIRWNGIKKSEALEEYVIRRAGLALDRIASRIRRVVVRFEDLNGPKGGVDKCCRVELTGDFGVRVAETRDVDFHAGADRALSIASRAVIRVLRRPIDRRGDGFEAREEESDS